MSSQLMYVFFVNSVVLGVVLQVLSYPYHRESLSYLLKLNHDEPLSEITFNSGCMVDLYKNKKKYLKYMYNRRTVRKCKRNTEVRMDGRNDEKRQVFCVIRG